MNQKSSQPSLKKNIAISTVYQVLLILLPLITAPYIARVIGPEGSGIYDYTNSVQTYFSMFAALGTMSYGAREIARVRENAAQRSKLFWEIELMTVITSSVCIAVWFILICFVTRYRIFYIVLTMGLISTMFDISWFFAGLEQFKYTVTKNAMCKLAGVVLMFLFVKDKDDVLLYVIIITASMMLGNMSMWLYLPRFITKVDFKTLSIRRHFKETLIYFIPSIATSVYTVLDRLLIGMITHDSAENGFYHYTMQIINMMKAVTFAALNSVLGSRIAYLFANEAYDEIRERIHDSINYILFMGVGICFGLIGVSSRFVPLFLGPGYDRVVVMLSMMSPIVIIIGISNCLGSQYYTPAGKRRQSARFIIIGALINLCLNLVLIPRFWGYGAIAASIAAELVITVLYIRYSEGYLPVRILWTEGWKKLASGVAMLAVIRLIDTAVKNNAAALVLEVAGGFAVYCLVLVLLHDSFISDIVFGKILHRG